MNGLRSKVILVVWAALVVLAAMAVWRIVLDVLGTTSLAVIAVSVFVGLAVLGGPPKHGADDISYKLTFRNILNASRVWLLSSFTGMYRMIYIIIRAIWSFPGWLIFAARDPNRTFLKSLQVQMRFERYVYAPRVVVERVTLSRASSVLLKTFGALWRTLAVTCAGLVLGLAILLGYVKEKFTSQMPNDMLSVTSYDPAVATDVYDRHGELICSFNTQYRVRVPIDKIDKKIVAAVVASEDDGFYGHHGIDPVSIVRAALKNAIGGRTKQGGSTITQQVVKQVLLANSERTVRRKVQEIILAVEMERRLTKRQILEVYLNQVFLGHNSYGVEAAMRTYFGKSASEVTVSEAALIAGLPQAPSRYSPYSHYPEARTRMKYVLDRMEATKAITSKQHREAVNEEIAIITVADQLNRSSAPYFCDLVRRELKTMFSNSIIFERGVVAHTTLDMSMQRKAEASVRLGLLDLERRLGFAGAEGHDQKFESACNGTASYMEDGALGKAVVMTVGSKAKVCMRGTQYPLHPEDIARVHDWEKEHPALVPGDVLTMRIETVTEPGIKGPVTKRYALPARRTGGAEVRRALQASMIVVDPRTGELRSLVGGYDFAENQFNNATMAFRQTGSSVKPFVYLTGLMRGMTVVDRLVDRQVCYGTASGTWCPSNYDDRFMGEVSLQTALAKSLNSISVQIGARVGVDAVIRTMRHLGITAPLDRAMPLFVGSEDLTPWEMTYAYSSIAAGGKVMPRRPGTERAGIFITSVDDNSGKELFRNKPVPRVEWPQAVPAADNYALIHLMRGVVEKDGTGQRVQELRRTAAGKTGTTNNSHDVWFFGFTPDLVASVWVGRQSSHYSIGGNATGGSVALPIWLAFMKAAHPDTPPTDFPPPSGILLVPDYFGQLVPFQQGRIPEDYLVHSKGLDEIL